MDKQDNTEANVSNQIGSGASRRKFLRKASAGALIATIPAKSVWATGLTNSVVASGHGSDMASGQTLSLQNINFFYNNQTMIPSGLLSQSFSTTFGVGARRMNGVVRNDDRTLGDILNSRNGNGTYTLRGINNFNLLMISTYLNAALNGNMGINFPVVGYDKSFGSLSQFGLALGTMSGNNPSIFASELRLLQNDPTSLAMTL